MSCFMTDMRFGAAPSRPARASPTRTTSPPTVTITSTGIEQGIEHFWIFGGSNMLRTRLLLAAAAAPALFASFARGDNYNWVPTAAGSFNWTDAANWTGGSNPYPQLTDDSATVQPGPAGPVNIALPIAVSIGNLNFGNSASPQLIDIGNGNIGGGTLNFVDS